MPNISETQLKEITNRVYRMSGHAHATFGLFYINKIEDANEGTVKFKKEADELIEVLKSFSIKRRKISFFNLNRDIQYIIVALVGCAIMFGTIYLVTLK